MVGRCTQRIAITGGARTGKSELAHRMAAQLGIRPELVQSTDDLFGVLGYAEAEAEVCSWLDQPGPWVCEGLVVARALRLWLRRNRRGTPCDRVIFLDGQPPADLPRVQLALSKGTTTVFNEIAPELWARGLRPVSRAA